MPEPDRIRRRRTFTMEDESYERLSALAKAANTNRSRFLEHLILMAEQVLSWQPPEPKRPWWKFWQRRVPAPPALTVIEPLAVQSRPRLESEPEYAQAEILDHTLDEHGMNGEGAAPSAEGPLDEHLMNGAKPEEATPASSG